MSLHRFQPRPGRQWSSAARSERADFLTAIQRALDVTRAQGRTTHAVVALHLDGPARVRAAHGDEAERQLLTAIRRRVQECMGADDRMASLDVEELQVLVACGPDASAAWRVAELLRHVVSAPYEVEGRAVSVTGYLGIAVIQPHHDSASAVIADAFAAVHRGRTSDASRCTLSDAAAHVVTMDQLELQAELRAAVDRAELRLHYQPIVACRTGALASIEALLRWQHPARGCLRPAAFLDALTRADLIGQVGRWIVGEVARQAVAWANDVGLSVPIAINVSPRQLGDPLFVPHALASIAAMGGSPRSIQFELTEEIELARGDEAIRALRRLRAQGYRVCIDDFGTGYSSLSYLQRLPIDAIKIDQAFVCSVDVDPRQRAIVRAVIQLAHVLDLDVIAEGIERAEQLDVVRSLGCDLAQGHHVAPPLPAEEMRDWIAARR